MMAMPPKRPSRSNNRSATGLASEEYTAENEIHSFTLRVQKDVIEQIDEIVSKHPVMRNRNTWIVNAIVEQLKREKHG
jgi:hypothetical protein